MSVRKIRLFRFALAIAAAVLLIILAACGQYSVPITERPNRNIETSLLGDWVSIDGRAKIKIRQLSESTYIVSYNGVLFKAFHSDISGGPFLSVQELETREQSYNYLTYRLSDDGTHLYLRLVNEELVPRDTKDSANIQKLLRRNLQNPALFHNEDEFTKRGRT